MIENLEDVLFEEARKSHNKSVSLVCSTRVVFDQHYAERHRETERHRVCV